MEAAQAFPHPEGASASVLLMKSNLTRAGSVPNPVRQRGVRLFFWRKKSGRYEKPQVRWQALSFSVFFFVINTG